MDSTRRTRILCVDDEPAVLEAVSLQLQRLFDVVVADGGPAGLALLERDRGIAVVLSDMDMPEMNGATFLGRVRNRCPDVVRVLLTGKANIGSAIAAVNEGQIFRFLTKPCPLAQLLATARAAVEQHRLITAERVLLEQTLHGSVKALMDVLALTSPAAFGRATRLKRLVTDLADRLGVVERWQVEMAALLSQLGVISLPQEVVDKLHLGQVLDDEQQNMVDRVPEITEQLLANIPRLEAVRSILARYTKQNLAAEPLSEDPALRTTQVGARLLRVALHYDALEARGQGGARAVEAMRDGAGVHDPKMLEALARTRGAEHARPLLREVPLAGLSAGMVFTEDVRLRNGVLLCARGYEVTPGFLQRVRYFRHGSIPEPVRVAVPA